jgi:DNA-binding response OmpR family regulator
MTRDKKHPARRLEFGDLVLDHEKQEVTVCGTPYHLTPKECRLLATFMRNADEILSKEFLMREVWDTDYADDTRTIQVHVSWLRSKIEADRSNPQCILTVRGVGYMFAKNGRT